jgi:putative transport protein
MGALTGAMTSEASLSLVTADEESAVPAIGYAGTYAFGNVLLMIAGPLVLLFGQAPADMCMRPGGSSGILAD